MTLSRLPLSYCTNVHPARTATDVIQGLSRFTAPIQQRVAGPVAAGLWPARSVATDLIDNVDQRDALSAALNDSGLICYTLNTFPYGDFHSEVVKEQVYLPDWSDPLRAEYTVDCARILSALLPDDTEGSLSTVPLGGLMNPVGPEFSECCIRNIIRTAEQLRQLRSETGQMIRLAIEPEPMCRLSSIPDDVLPFFAELFREASHDGAEETVRSHVGLCFDVCHQAVEYEDIGESVRMTAGAGIRINKVHITNALELMNPGSNIAGREALCEYAEPRYLHQTYARFADGTVERRTDLTLEDLRRTPPDRFMNADSWRIHFHVPIFAEEIGPLKTTRRELRNALRAISSLDYAPHLEVETYTWPVMLSQGDTDTDDKDSRLIELISDELNSAHELLADTTTSVPNS